MGKLKYYSIMNILLYILIIGPEEQNTTHNMVILSNNKKI